MADEYFIQAGLVFIYLLSFFSLAATIVRLVFVVRFDKKIYDVSNVKERIDYSYWATIEITTAIICANLPALPALYRRLTGRDKLLPISGSSSKANNQTSAFSHSRLAKNWMDEKWSILLQTTARRTGSGTGTGRTESDDASSSQRSLTGFNTGNAKNSHIVEMNEIGVLPPSQSSYKSSHVSYRGKEEGLAGVGTSSGESLVLPPLPASEGVSVIYGGDAARREKEESVIYRTDEINVTKSLA